MISANDHINIANNCQQLDDNTRNNSISSESSVENNSFSHDPYKSYGFHYIEETQSQNQKPSGIFVHQPYNIKVFSQINPKLKF